MAYLPMSRDQFLASVNSASTLKFDKLVVGAAILRNEAEVLLLKRRADEKHYPNVYEIPGGKVEHDDPTIQDAITREVLEESNLSVKDVSRPLSVITYTTESGAGTRNVIQLSYVITVQDTQFQVNPEEHSTGIWANIDMLAQLEITQDMKTLVSEALVQEAKF
ncbi:NUDIX hydrolase domain-like protein [Ustulina deusta]|nr:NUDIX hydrolase domain-like protein [Ustulina deusta]